MQAQYLTMKLKEYLALKDMTDSQFSDVLGKDRSVVTKYRLGTVTPPLEVIAKIEKATNGAVSFQDFLAPPSEAVA
jgi:transcriptional regulator with XRE-family HTH domain